MCFKTETSYYAELYSSDLSFSAPCYNEPYICLCPTHPYILYQTYINIHKNFHFKPIFSPNNMNKSCINWIHSITETKLHIKTLLLAWCHTLVIWFVLFLGRWNKEDQAHWVNCIHNVYNQIDAGHYRHNNQVVPVAGVTYRWSRIVPEAVEWPHNHCRHVHHNRQHIITRQTFIKRKGASSQQPTDCQEDDEKRDDEADGVDCHTPLQPRKITVKVWVQRDEDNTGNKGLHNLQ